jgi:hypothetical protein
MTPYGVVDGYRRFEQKKLACSIYDSTNAWRDNVF